MRGFREEQLRCSRRLREEQVQRCLHLGNPYGGLPLMAEKAGNETGEPLIGCGTEASYQPLPHRCRHPTIDLLQQGPVWIILGSALWKTDQLADRFLLFRTQRCHSLAVEEADEEDSPALLTPLGGQTPYTLAQRCN
jgi:hypothetical protein